MCNQLSADLFLTVEILAELMGHLSEEVIVKLQTFIARIKSPLLFIAYSFHFIRLLYTLFLLKATIIAQTSNNIDVRLLFLFNILHI